MFTVTLPFASRFVRSVTLKMAFFAVGVQTPLAQFIFWVGFDEIVTAACAETAVQHRAAIAIRIAKSFIEFPRGVLFRAGAILPLPRRIGKSPLPGALRDGQACDPATFCGGRR